MSANERADDARGLVDRTLYASSAHMWGSSSLTGELAADRGERAGALIYTLLGLALTIEIAAVALVTPLAWRYWLIMMAIVGSFTIYLFLGNGRFRTKLISPKDKTVSKYR